MADYLNVEVDITAEQLEDSVKNRAGRKTANGGEIFNDYHLNEATAPYSHAEGQETRASGENSHTSGYRTVAGYDNQFVCGQRNNNKEGTLFEVGNGVQEDYTNSNAFEVYKDGHAEVQKMGNTDNSVVTKKALEEALADIEIPEGEAPDLDGYVKNTDYATTTKAGIVKINNANGVRVDNNNALIIDTANDSEIANKKNINAPLKPHQIDKVVKAGVTTNTIELTDEEKANACEWLGALETSELNSAINNALAQAKASGEFNGANGTSVTVKSVSESTADGGSNVVTFSDGKTVTIKNGSKGSSGVSENILFGKKIVYDGDSICESRSNNGGGYARLIADMVGGTYFNNAVSGKRLAYVSDKRNVVSELSALPTDGDIYCFEGGYNDYWTPVEIGECDLTDYTGELNTSTICGALETIFRYALNNFVGRPICFAITHKCGNTGYTANSLGHTFDDYRKAMIKVCEKYSIPYYDAFANSGLNGWNQTQSNLYMTANVDGTGDGIHPNEAGYRRYYVPQLIKLFQSIIPVGITQDEPSEEIINQIPISIDTDGSVFNTKGWIEGKRISSSGEVKSSTSYNMTGFIEIKPTDKLYIGSGIWNHEAGSSTYNCVAGYKSDFSFINVFYDNSVGFTKNADGSYRYDLAQQSVLADVKYVRIVGDGIDDNSIITINQPIE